MSAENRPVIAQYNELAKIPTIDNGEDMVSLTEANVPIYLFDKDLPKSTGEDIFVRESVAEKMRAIDLPKGFSIAVTYGYRSPVIQSEKFKAQLLRFAEEKIYTSQEELIQLTHEMIAAPNVAGHPTGGAVDVWLKDSIGQLVDMGTEMHDLSDASKVFNRAAISEEQFQNRMILRDAMAQVGFAPYDGEWWHFCYGDREWAYLTDAPNALYEQVDFDYEKGVSRQYIAETPENILSELSL